MRGARASCDADNFSGTYRLQARKINDLSEPGLSLIGGVMTSHQSPAKLHKHDSFRALATCKPANKLYLGDFVFDLRIKRRGRRDAMKSQRERGRDRLGIIERDLETV